MSGTNRHRGNGCTVAATNALFSASLSQILAEMIFGSHVLHRLQKKIFFVRIHRQNALCFIGLLSQWAPPCRK